MGSEWQYDAVKLDDLVDSPITYGVVKPGDDGDVPFVRGGDISGGRIAVSQLRTITDEVSKQYKRTLLQGGELLVSLVGNPGQVAIAPNELEGANIARQVGLVRLPNEVDTRYVSYFLQSPIGQSALGAQSLGSVQQVINLRDLRNVKVPLPPLSEQRAIAGVLGSLDDKIALNRRMNRTLESMARALFLSWFVDFDPTHANATPTPGQPTLPPDLAARFPATFTPSPLGNIPAGWEVRKVGDCIARLKVGLKYNQKSASVSGTIPILDQGKSGIIGYHSNEPGVIATLQEPVVVFANHTCYMRLITFPFSTIQNVLPFVGKGVDTVWAFYATLGLQSFVEYKGHWPDFLINEIIVPTPELTNMFRRQVQPFIEKIQKNEEESRTLAALRDALLPKLLGGELHMQSSERSEIPEGMVG